MRVDADLACDRLRVFDRVPAERGATAALGFFVSLVVVAPSPLRKFFL